MSHAQITRKFPGKDAGQIFERVDHVMGRLAEKHSFHYHKDETARSGKVSKMGVTGAYYVKDEEVTVELKFPMLIPGSMRQKVQEDIERKLDGLFA